jgi:exopolysaccharide production protein ExoQ
MRTTSTQATPIWPTPAARSLGTTLADLSIGAWLFLCSSAVFPLLMLNDASTLSEESASTLRLLILPSLLAAPLLLVVGWQGVIPLLRRHLALVLLCIWIWLSVIWSVEPSVTLRRAASFTANTVILCWIATHVSPAAVLRNLTIVLILVLALSLLFAVFLPALAFMPDGGEFRGVFVHKNVMGLALVEAALLAAISWHARLVSRPVLLSAYAIIALMAIPTGSATTLMLLMALVVLHVPLKVAALPKRQAAGGILLLVLGSITILLPLLLARNRIFMALGRDVTLTGRTELWDFVDSFIAQRPLVGFGYGAFFEVQSVVEQVNARIGWGAPNAHHGYREILLGLGLVGLTLTVGILLKALWRALCRVMRDPHDIASRFAFLYLCIYLFRNFSESDLLAQSDLSWVLAGLAVVMPTAASLMPVTDAVPVQRGAAT